MPTLQEHDFLAECAQSLVEHIKLSGETSLSIQAGPVATPSGVAKLLVQVSRQNDDQCTTLGLTIEANSLGFLSWAPGKAIDKERLLAQIRSSGVVALSGLAECISKSMAYREPEGPRLVLVGGGADVSVSP